MHRLYILVIPFILISGPLIGPGPSFPKSIKLSHSATFAEQQYTQHPAFKEREAERHSMVTNDIENYPHMPVKNSDVLAAMKRVQGMALERETSKGVCHMDTFLEKISYYEANRARSPTFDSYYPIILDAF